STPGRCPTSTADTGHTKSWCRPSRAGTSFCAELAGVVQQRLRAAGVAQLGQGLLLQLTDPLPGEAECAPDLVQRVRVPVVEAEPHRHDRGLPRRQRVERAPELVRHELAVHEL